jgi:hypothetical protein
MTRREEIFDFDAIPSLQVEPVSAKLVEEEEKSPTTNGMEIDSYDRAQGHEPIATRNPQQPARVEASHRMNGGNNERKQSVGPRPQLVVGSTQQEEVHIEDIMGQPKSSREDREPEVGTSSALVRKGKKSIVWSPCK